MFQKIKYLVLVCLVLIPIIVSAQSEQITYGESISIDMTDDVPQHFFNFEGTAGTLIYVSVVPADVAQNVPVYLRLMTENGLTVAESDNEELSPLLLPQDGGYTLEVTRQPWSEDTGTVQLFINETALIPVDETYTAIFDASARGEIAFYTFEGNEGDIHQVGATCAECNMTLFAPSGTIAHASGGYENPFTPIISLPESGQYTLWFQNTAAAGQLSVAIPRIDATPLTGNNPIDGTIGDDLLYFSFESVAGKVWQINTEIPYTGERFIGIYQPRGREFWEAGLIIDEGSGADSNPRISSFIAPEDATYYVIMSYRAFDNDNGEAPYNITLAPDSITRLVLDTPTSRTITPETGAQQFLYAGTAGETVNILLSKESNSGSMGLLVLSSDDEVVNAGSRNAEFMSFVVTLPLDGDYEFIISNFDYDTSSELAFILELKPIDE